MRAIFAPIIACYLLARHIKQPIAWRFVAVAALEIHATAGASADPHCKKWWPRVLDVTSATAAFESRSRIDSVLMLLRSPELTPDPTLRNLCTFHQRSCCTITFSRPSGPRRDARSHGTAVTVENAWPRGCDSSHDRDARAFSTTSNCCALSCKIIYANVPIPAGNSGAIWMPFGACLSRNWRSRNY